MLYDSTTGEVLDIPADVTAVSLSLPDGLSVEQWSAYGDRLSRVAEGVMWWLGDWWWYGQEHYGEAATRKVVQEIAERHDWAYATIKEAVRVTQKVPIARRRAELTFEHHKVISDMPPEEQAELLDWAAQDEKAVTVLQLRQEKDRRKKQARDDELLQRFEERAEDPLDGLHACRAVDLIEHVEAGSVDLIFTDPPYPVEFIDCWAELGKLAVHALKPGGLVVAYTGQYTMLDALDRLRAAGLSWYWCYAIQHTGAFFQMRATRVQCGWKPLLVMRNGNGELPDWHKDIVTDGHREKAEHDWQQAESEAAYWIGQLSKPDDLVCDPFLGSGTTAAVAKTLGRRFIGCDIDPARVEVTRERISK
jgi:predicted transcriptional regulator